MPAFAMMAVIRHQANQAAPRKKTGTDRQAPIELIRWSVQEIRRIATRLAARRIAPARIIAWVMPATRSPSRGRICSPQENATVMVGI